MTLEQFGSVGEMIGGLAVVLTLLYLAFETRRNTTVHIASTTSDAYLNWAASNQANATDTEVIGIFVRVSDNQPLDSFDPSDRFRLEMILRSLFQRLASIHQQHQNGLVDDEFWQIHKVWFASYINVKAVGQWWELEKRSSLFTASFIHELEQTKGFALGSSSQRLDEGAS
jgi:hypothetical protein